MDHTHKAGLSDMAMPGDVFRVSVTQSCLTLCDPMDCSPPGSAAHGILQARILEWVAVPFSRDQTQVSCIAGRFFTERAIGKP